MAQNKPIIDFRALWEWLTTGKDTDVFPDYTVAGGVRSPEKGKLIGAQGSTARTVGTGPSGHTKKVDPVAVDPAQAEYEAYMAQAAAQEAAATARKNQYRGEASSQIDNLLKIYDELISAVEATGSDKLSRIVGDFKDKMTEQLSLLDEAKYNVDANSAAAGLADSSFRSLDRQKVKNAADANVKALQTASTDAQAELGEKIMGTKAKYQGAKDLLTSTTRPMLDRTQDEGELLRTIGSLGGEAASAQAAKASFQPAGEFTKSINQIGGTGNTPLANILDSIVMNKEASRGTKQSTMLGLIDNSVLSEQDKQALKNKYIQSEV